MMSRTHKLAYISGDDVSARIPIVKKLNTLGYEIEIMGSEGKEKFVKNHVPYSKYFLNREFGVLDDMKSRRELVELMRKKRFELVHSFDTKPNMLVPSAARKLGSKRPKVVRTITGVGRIFTSNSLKNRILRIIYHLIQKRLRPSIDMTIFQNKDDYDYFIKHQLVFKEKARIVKSSGIDLEDFDINNRDEKTLLKLKKELGLKENVKTFILVGRLVNQKGVREYLQAARICKEKGMNFNVLLVGPIDTKDDAVPEDYINQFDDCVKYIGKRSDVRELLQLSDVFVLPTFYREGVPRVLLEAAAMGLGIITTDMPGCNDVVRNDWNGYLVPIKNSSAIASAMMKIVKDDKKLSLFGKRNLVHVKNFSLKKVFTEYHNIYKEILK